MSSWRDTTLREFVRIEHGFAFKGVHFADSGEYVVLTPGNFHEAGGFRARPEKDRFYAAPFPERYLLKKDDLIVAMTEQGEGLLGSAARIPESKRYLHNQRLGLVLPKPTADQRFLFYLFNSDYVRQQIRNSSSGSKVRHTSPERMYRVAVRAPGKATQRKIAAVLAGYDDLIEANRRRIALLERMAEELYREWFVRLRFPGYEKTKITKSVPAGWSVKKLGEIVSEMKRGIRQRDLTAEQRYIGLEHISRKSIALREWGFADSVDSNKLLFTERDILFSKIRPYLHKVSLAHFQGVCSTDTIVLRPTERAYEGFVLFTVFSDTFIELATVASNGTKMPRADWKFLKKLELVVPSHDLCEVFQAQFDAQFSQIVTLLRANEILQRTRDLLLPRLISGKLPVEALPIAFPPSMAATAPN